MVIPVGNAAMRPTSASALEKMDEMVAQLRKDGVEVPTYFIYISMYIIYFMHTTLPACVCSVILSFCFLFLFFVFVTALLVFSFRSVVVVGHVPHYN